jgi:serine/threonine-protein kinase
MLTGKPPYEGDTAYDIVVKHINDKVPSVRQYNPNLPVEIDYFMQKALAKSPADRFATPQHFMTALEQLQEYVQPLSAPHVRKPDSYLLAPTRVANLVVLSNGRIFPLKGDQMLVGREDRKQQIFPQIDLTGIDADKTVGRQHAYLRHRQGTYTVENFKALNKTRVNGTVLASGEKCVLKDGDILCFGSVEVRFEQR